MPCGSLSYSRSPSFSRHSRVRGDQRRLPCQFTCFHDQHLIASLRIDGDSAIVETFRGTGNFAPGYGFQPVRSVSAVHLAGLFQLLEDYQRPAAGWCSSSDRGRVTITRSGESARVEEFDGNSCGRFDDGEPTFNWFMLAEIVALTDKAG